MAGAYLLLRSRQVELVRKSWFPFLFVLIYFIILFTLFQTCCYFVFVQHTNNTQRSKQEQEMVNENDKYPKWVTALIILAFCVPFWFGVWKLVSWLV